MDDNDVCPLCCEELDMSDRQFFPCKCGYQVCMWCWHRIRESESGLCPACRTPYGDDPHEFSAVDMQEVVKANKEKAAAEKREKERLRQQQRVEMQQVQAAGGPVTGATPGGHSGPGSMAAALSSGLGDGGAGSAGHSLDSHHHSHSNPSLAGLVGSDGTTNRVIDRSRSLTLDPPKDRSQLANMRVIRRNLVYAVGLPPAVATEDTLKKPEYFGQYGKISKIVINRNYNGNGDPRRASASAYVTFAHKEDTLACILALDGFYLEGRNIRASYGTSKYCSAFIKNVRCNNPDCTYLHHMGDQEDNFTKQEIQAGYVTSGRDVLAKQQQQMAIATSSSSGVSVSSQSGAASSAVSSGAGSGGSTRRRVGGGGPSGSGKVPPSPVFPPPCFDEPLSSRERTGSSLVPSPNALPHSHQTRHVRSASFGSSSNGTTSSAVGFANATASSSLSAGGGSNLTASPAGPLRKPVPVGGTIPGISTKKSLVALPGSNAASSLSSSTSAATGTTAASVVAAAASPHIQSSSSSVTSANPHTTLTPLTPLKRTSSLPASAGKSSTSVGSGIVPSKGGISATGSIAAGKAAVGGGSKGPSNKIIRSGSAVRSSSIGSIGAVGSKAVSKSPLPTVTVSQDGRAAHDETVTGSVVSDSNGGVNGTVITDDEGGSTSFIGGATILGGGGGGGMIHGLEPQHSGISGAAFPSAVFGQSSKRGNNTPAPIGSQNHSPALTGTIGSIGSGASNTQRGDALPGSSFNIGAIGGPVIGGVSDSTANGGFGPIGGGGVTGGISALQRATPTGVTDGGNVVTVGTIGGGKKQNDGLGAIGKSTSSNGAVGDGNGSLSHWSGNAGGADSIFAPGNSSSPAGLGGYSIGGSGPAPGGGGIWGASSAGSSAPVSPCGSNTGFGDIRTTKSFGSTANVGGAGDDRFTTKSPTQPPIGSVGAGVSIDNKNPFAMGLNNDPSSVGSGTRSSALASMLGIDLPTGSDSLRAKSNAGSVPQRTAAITPPPSASSPRHFTVGPVGSTGLQQPVGGPQFSSVGDNYGNIQFPASSSSSFSGVPIGGLNVDVSVNGIQQQHHPREQGDALWGGAVSSNGLGLDAVGHQYVGHKPGAIGTPSGRRQAYDQSVHTGGAPGVVGGGAAPIGGITIGGGSGVSSDIALLQSLLPGVHITTGGANAAVHHQQPVGLGGPVLAGGNNNFHVAGGAGGGGWNANAGGVFGGGDGPGNNWGGAGGTNLPGPSPGLYGGGPATAGADRATAGGGNGGQQGGSSIW